MAEQVESVGSVGEEVFKLLAALKGLGENGGPEDAEPAGGPERRDDSGQQPRAQPLGSEGPSSCWCPLCRAVGALQQSRPEVAEHLAAAASELMRAGAALLQNMSTTPQAETAQSSETTNRRGDDDDLEDA